MSDVELETLRELLSFSSVTSTDLSSTTIEQKIKYKKSKITGGWESFEQMMNQKGSYQSLEFMKKLFNIATDIFGNNLETTFTELGFMSFKYKHARGRSKVFLAAEIRKKKELPIWIYKDTGLSMNKSSGQWYKIQSEEDFENWAVTAMKEAYQKIVDQNKIS